MLRSRRVLFMASQQAYDPDLIEERVACLLEESININKLLVCLHVSSLLCEKLFG